jgi:hypothetical protein
VVVALTGKHPGCGPADPRIAQRAADLEAFVDALRDATRDDHFALTPTLLDSRYVSIAGWLFVAALQAHVEDRLTRRLAPPGAPVQTSAPTGATPAALVAWAVERFGLMKAGALRRLDQSGNDQLRAGIHLVLHQEVLAAARVQYRDYPHVSVDDVAHQLIHENYDRWCRDFDPSRRPLGAYLARRVRPKQLLRSGARAVGLAGDLRVPDGASDDPLARVVDRVDAERAVPPRAEWPRSVELQFGQNLTPAEAASAAGVPPNRHRSEVSRFVRKARAGLDHPQPS